MKKILITGGAGFIGSNIAEQYIQQGQKVVIIDNLCHGFKKNIPTGAKFYKIDINNLNAVRKIIKKEKPQIINHHAAIAEVVKSVTNPVPTLTTNVQGTVNLLLTSVEIGIQKFIFASTGGAIYGETKKRPTAETVSPCPLSPYGLSKLLAEQCIEYYARLGKFNYLIFRYPNVYGPNQDPHGEAGVVAIFTKQMRADQQPIIFGDGTKTRDYVYVKDVAQVNLIALHKGNRQIINLGLGKEIADKAVYDTISQHFTNPKKVQYKPVRPGEVLRSCLEAKLAKKILGWKPQYSFKQGIKDYLEITN